MQKSSDLHQNILEIKNISKAYKKDLFKKNTEVLHGLSCSFPKGKTTGLLGHNGAGKTTTIKLILGLIYPDNGDILFEGTPIKRKNRKLLGYMPETNKLPINLTVLELLHGQFSINQLEALSGEKFKKRIETKLKEIQLWEHRHKRIKNLSKGMGRRISWAIASIHNPELLILDEPFSGLDPLGRYHMNQWILNEKQKGTSIVLCTHELNHIDELCDEVYIMQDGNIIYSSLSPDETDSVENTQYTLQVSGTTQKALLKMKKDLTLNPWHKIHQEGFSSTLTFSDYESASAWLEACFIKNIFIINFNSTSRFSSQNLIKYFSPKEEQL